MFAFQTPTQALSLSFRKQKPTRKNIDGFKQHLKNLLDHLGVLDSMQANESEEHLKNLVRDFLKETYYKTNHYLNTGGRKDLVIHNGADAKSKVGVIIEAKRPANKAEMITKDNLNARAFQELLLYYLRERVTANNIEIKRLVVTNINEWFIFDAQDFEKLFAQNKELVKQFNEFEQKRLTGTDTAFFYNEIAAPAIQNATQDLTLFNYTHFNLNDYKTPLLNADPNDDKELIDLYKILSPEHLLKLPFANDSNSLDRGFYNELLHIMGLNEVKIDKDGKIVAENKNGKKVIQRKLKEKRNAGSLLENAIAQLDSLDKVSRLPNAQQYGETTDEKLFNAGLELVITWVNRVLFLKLLEAQLVRYHKGNKAFAFLNNETISGFDELNSLFFSVLAKKPPERSDEVKQKYANVPYLNSSLFEPTELEHATIFISNLMDDRQLPVLAATVLRDPNEKPQTGNLKGLQYLFDFLGAYDFGAEGEAEIQEENKTLINASVLGLIFEKINGYRDGSFFTPGFITMYMCRETIRRAVAQKFCENFADLPADSTFETLIEYRKTLDFQRSKAFIPQANALINSLRICDPAVGSGHFLVSALNELIAIKSELSVLCDKNGAVLNDYQIRVENDELVLYNNFDFFQYDVQNPKSRIIQETLFHEKQTLIENCLFGVDINPNSVKICRLRLWIELLKNAYYTAESKYTELETLPNIDINIKCGNSLISRFDLTDDLTSALHKSKWTIDTYRNAVAAYKNATDRDEKRTLVKLIDDIKNSFSVEISLNDADKRKLDALQYEILQKYNGNRLFTENLTKAQQKELAKMEKEVAELEARWEEKKSGRLYDRAFEWRFEFPEVLNDEGVFLGFDVVVGNPPYGSIFQRDSKKFISTYYQSYNYKYDGYVYFIERGFQLLKQNQFLNFITPSLWLLLESNFTLRKLIIENYNLQIIKLFGENVFNEAVVNTAVLFAQKNREQKDIEILIDNDSWKIKLLDIINDEKFTIFYSIKSKHSKIIHKIETNSFRLKEFGYVKQGITPYDSYRGQSQEIIKNRIYHHKNKIDDTCGQWLNGKDITSYSINWSGEWLSYGEWLAAAREPDFFNGNRLLFREIPGKQKKIQAVFTSELYYYGHSITPFIPNDRISCPLYFILGVVNSALISWYAQLKFSNFGKDIFPKLNPHNIKEIPIPKCSIEKQTPIETLVSEILTLKAANPAADTTAQEAEIDRLVYQLYDLTPEEIALVEAA